MSSKYAFNRKNREQFLRYPERSYLHPFRMAGNLYFVGNGDVGSHLIDTGDGLILIDTTYPQTAGMLIQSIWEMGFQPRQIKYILHTHGHFDHFGATRLLTVLSGAKTFLGWRDARMFRERPELALREYNTCPTELFEPDVEMHDGDLIELGDTRIRVVETPGHSDGVVTFLIELPVEGKTLVAGLQGGAGLNTLCRDFIQQYGNIHAREEYLSSLERIRGERVDIVLGNHTVQNHTMVKRGRMTAHPEQPNPFIDPAEWPKFIDSLRARFDRMLQDEAEGTDQIED